LKCNPIAKCEINCYNLQEVIVGFLEKSRLFLVAAKGVGLNV
jgi:hypothetical protein